MGETRTFNQKRFTISGRRNIQPGVKLPIKFFVKYDELGEIPQVTRVFVDGVLMCLSGSTTLSANLGETSGQSSVGVTKSGGILLSDLPLQAFPSVTQIPQQVDNVSCD